MAKSRGMQVVVAFGNNWFDATPQGSTQPNWVAPYSNQLVNLEADSVLWINGFVSAIEGSSGKTSVIYYDYENEYNRGWPNMQSYLIYVYDNCVVPKGKRGESVLDAKNDAADLQFALTSVQGPQLGLRHMDYVDFHSYPGQTPPANPDVEQAFDAVRAQFPDSTILLGEFGQGATSASEEGACPNGQQCIVANLASRAVTKGIAYYLNWMLTDTGTAPFCCASSWAYDIWTPKSVMGGISTQYSNLAYLNLLKNPDMEFVNGSVPWNWVAGGTIANSLSSMGPQRSDAATNNYYARLTMTGAGYSWISSDLTPVKSGETLYVNGYIRGNASVDQAWVTVVQFDSAGSRTNSTGPSFVPWAAPNHWQWNSYLGAVQSWSVPLLKTTANIQVQVSAHNSGGSGLMDIDTFSAWQRP